MKLAFSSLFLLFSFLSIAQDFDQLGQGDDGNLSMVESDFLNKYLKDQKGDFDFEGKKIVFIKGNSGHQFGTKREYFKQVKKWKSDYGESIASRVIIFSDVEKEKANGYDGIVTYWVKILSKNRKKKIIKKLSR